MSHLHGCIEFFDSRYKNDVYKKEVVKYGFHDLYKYDSYDKVRDMYNGSSKSKPSNQAGEQFINAPIITGLLKTDKLNILPFSFYHGHLYNCVMNSNSLLVVGYSFGDLYINQLLERMELIYGDKKRVVLIDYWKLMVESMVIDNKILDELSAQEKASPRLRMAMDLRNTPEDLSQRMLNVEKDRWYSLECLESGSVLYSSKDGPYHPLQDDEILQR